MHGAQEVDERTAPDLVGMVRELAERAGLPMPRVYLMDNPQPNAFATGRNPEHAAVAVTTGLLDRLSREEVAGVIAHELAHIKNRDTLIMTITATIAGAISMLAQFGMFFGGNRDNNNGGARHDRHAGDGDPRADRRHAGADGDQPHARIRRRRSRRADRRPADWLASRAGASFEAAAHAIPNEAAERNPATAHMFIINPLSGQRMDNLFSTHPATENRIAALEQLAQRDGRRNARRRLVRAQPRRAAGGPWSQRPASRPTGPWG